MTRVDVLPYNHQQGQALVEYIYVFPVLIMLILGAIQFGFIYQTKSTLNYATFTATRQGALNGGLMSEMVDGLASGMMPLFTHSKGKARDLDTLKEAWKLSYSQVSDPDLTTITIVNPSQSVWNDFYEEVPDSTFLNNLLPPSLGPVLSLLQGSKKYIPNDNLMYRSETPRNNVTIQDANLLKVRVTYCYRMAVPILNKLIYNLVVDPPSTLVVGNTAADMLASEGGNSSAKACTKKQDDAYRIPITSEAIVRMQTPFMSQKWVGP